MGTREVSESLTKIQAVEPSLPVFLYIKNQKVFLLLTNPETFTILFFVPNMHDTSQ